ncbi:hypothetical protein LWI28_005524 [Acer negundo]|uniref:Uncharacterized protein n=1 Tax=Acer negundo TaxID=4023 RepID=A0AAD5IC95_ACENE|nr:hypothetical protein LWI28_005524 [Acer negundo]
MSMGRLQHENPLLNPFPYPSLEESLMRNHKQRWFGGGISPPTRFSIPNLTLYKRVATFSFSLPLLRGTHPSISALSFALRISSGVFLLN